MGMVIVTAIIGLLTIAANIIITSLNDGKNRKIYEIVPINDVGGKKVNEILNSGDYTILHVGPCNIDMSSKTYVLGKLNSGKKG